MFFCCRTEDYDDQPNKPPLPEEENYPVFGEDDGQEDPFDDDTPLESRDRLSAIDRIERERAKREADRLAAARAAYKASDDGRDVILVLVTGMPSNGVTATQQDRIRKCFESWAIPTREVNGAHAMCHEQRDKLFAISGTRSYPQVFTRISGTVEFVGGHDVIDQLAECESLPPAELAAHPEILTFTERFAHFLR